MTPRVWPVGWVGYFNTVSGPTGSNIRQLSDDVCNIVTDVSKDCSVSFLVPSSRRKNGLLDPESEGTMPELFSERHGTTY